MSLLDDVSIVVTPNGYKAGELYAVIPVPTEGAEMLSQPVDLQTDFTAVNGASIVDANTFTTTGGSVEGLTKAAILTVGTQYKLIIEGTTTSSGFSLGNTTAGGNEYGSGFGTHYFTASGNNTLWLRQSTAGTTDITSFSVKEYTSADMDVTRATAATRVDENGLVNYAEIVTGSDIVTNGDFSNGSTDWTLQNGWELGSNDMVFIPSASSYRKLFQVNFLTIGKVYKLSFEIKSISAGSIANFEPNSPSFNTVGVKTQVFTATFDDLYLEPTTDANLTIDNISVKEVTRDNVPRIDYTGGGCPHILAEPMRTNLIPYSEEISQYNQSSSTASDNETISPDGTNNASKISKDGVNANDRVTTIITISNSTDYSLSAFIKNDDVANGGVSTIGARITGGTVFRQGYEWNGSTLSVTNSSQSGTRTNVLLEDYGNGWWKVGFSFTSDGTEARLEFDIDRVNGTDTTAIFLWGAQLEAGSYGTSYIPNFGTVAGVTRNQDIFTRDGIGSLINSTEGVLFVEMAALSNDGTFREISINDGSSDHLISLRYRSTNNQINIFVRNGSGNTIVNISTTLADATNFYKIALKYKSGDYALWVDGTETITSSASEVPSGLNELSLSRGGGSDYFFGKVKQLQVYDTALTDEQLLQLTGESGTDFYESYAEMASALTYTIQ